MTLNDLLCGDVTLNTHLPYYPAYNTHPIDNTHPLPKSLPHM